MYVCLCRAVNSTRIESVIQDGASTVDAVGERCGAGTVCGKCRHTIAVLLERTAEARSAVGR
jgi:bacterioferritin-associated ferredoxin